MASRNKTINNIPAPEPYDEEAELEKQRRGCVQTLYRIDTATKEISDRVSKHASSITRLCNTTKEIKESTEQNRSFLSKVHDRIDYVYTAWKNVCGQFNENLLKIFECLKVINNNMIQFDRHLQAFGTKITDSNSTTTDTYPYSNMPGDIVVIKESIRELKDAVEELRNKDDELDVEDSNDVLTLSTSDLMEIIRYQGKLIEKLIDGQLKKN